MQLKTSFRRISLPFLVIDGNFRLKPRKASTQQSAQCEPVHPDHFSRYGLWNKIVLLKHS
jgi:hypothetical protein